MKILIAGDFCPIGRINSFLENKRYSEVFNGFENYTKKMDLSIVNLECPVTLSNKKIQKSGPNIKSENHLQVFESLKFAGFNLLTLANNHILDYGQIGVMDTLNYIKSNDLLSVGAAENFDLAGEGIKIAHGDKVLGILNIAENEFCSATSESYGAYTVDLIDNYKKINKLKRECDFLLLIYHGGREHFQLPTPEQRKRLKFYLDIGVDAVICHHTHCYSGYEWYKNKPIFYSLGNFIFDYKRKYQTGKWTEGYFVSLNIDFNSRTVLDFDLTPYYQGRLNDCSLKFMNSKDLSEFHKNIDNINSILNDDAEYQKRWDEYLKTQRSSYLAMVYFKNKYLRAAASKEIIPIIRNKNYELLLKNINRCETHSEIIKNLLNVD